MMQPKTNFETNPATNIDPPIDGKIGRDYAQSRQADPQWEAQKAIRRLQSDLSSGASQARSADLLALGELDLGYRLVKGPPDEER